jgi:phage protein U
MAGPFCTLGDLVLQLAEAPGTFKEKYAFEFAEHPVLQGKPKLQAIGGKLDELQLEFQHHAGKSDIGFIVNRLSKMLDGAEVVTLTMGDGEYLGQFVVTDLNFDRTTTFANGTSMAATFGVSLREYVASPVLVAMKRPAVKTGNPGKKKDGGIFDRNKTGSIIPKAK